MSTTVWRACLAVILVVVSSAGCSTFLSSNQPPKACSPPRRHAPHHQVTLSFASHPRLHVAVGDIVIVRVPRYSSRLLPPMSANREVACPIGHRLTENGVSTTVFVAERAGRTTLHSSLAHPGGGMDPDFGAMLRVG